MFPPAAATPSGVSEVVLGLEELEKAAWSCLRRRRCSSASAARPSTRSRPGRSASPSPSPTQSPAPIVSTFVSGFYQPTGLAFDAAGNLYVANSGGLPRSSEVTPAGAVSIFASGFNGPEGLAFDAAGNLYVVQLRPPPAR